MPRQTFTLTDLRAMSIRQLKETAAQLSLTDLTVKRKEELIVAIIRAPTLQHIVVEGVIEVLPDGFGFLRAPEYSYLPSADDVYVSPSVIRKFHLETGDTVSGVARPPKPDERYLAHIKTDAINFDNPDKARERTSFADLTPVYPQNRLHLDVPDGTSSWPGLALFKGQRGLVVASKRTDRQKGLKALADLMDRNHPEVYRIVLLLDARPGIANDIRQRTAIEVVSTAFDDAPARHVQVATLVLEKARRLVESRKDVLIVLDSVTSLARAYQAAAQHSHTLAAESLDSAALQGAKQFVGAARSVAEGGSLTIIAVAHAETGAVVDDVLLREIRPMCDEEIRLDTAQTGTDSVPTVDERKRAAQSGDLLDGTSRARDDSAPEHPNERTADGLSQEASPGVDARPESARREAQTAMSRGPSTGPYQVFVSFKATDEQGVPTEDSALAREMYSFLTAQGWTVFNSDVSLQELGVSAYKKAIDAALDGAQVLVVVGTSEENFRSEWVQYEWDSFFNDVLSGIKPDGRVFVYAKGVRPERLPRALRQSQAIVHSTHSLSVLGTFISNALREQARS